MARDDGEREENREEREKMSGERGRTRKERE